MKLTKFKVENYRSILDSGWVEIDDIAVIVGKNESGKTSLLKALWKLNPFHDTAYNIHREFPTGRRKDKSDDKTVVTAIFALSDEEQKKLAAIHESAKDVKEVQVTRNYKGTRYFSFLPKSPATAYEIPWVVSLLDERLAKPPAAFSDHFKPQYEAAYKEYRVQVADKGTQRAIEVCQELKNRMASFVHPNHPFNQTDNTALQSFNAVFDKTKEIIIKTPLQRAADTAHSWLPTFVYMDDYRIFSGAAQLDEVLRRKQQKATTKDDDTVTLIMEMAGLNLEKEVEKGNSDDKEQRILDMHDASQTLTNLIADHWKQKKYEVMFQADGQHFITFVKDIGQKGLVPLEERSKGFQWFFSFDMTFMYETQGKFKNAVILLDEPGLHLHAAAQADLVQQMKSYAKNNQLVYTTHLPFMIDFTRLDNIYVCEEKGAEGSKTHKDWATADKDARFTMQAALGLNWSQSLFVGQFNLVVEGLTDYWFLTGFSQLLKESGESGLDDQLVITHLGGASKAAYVATILHGQKLNVAVLLDSDKEGNDAAQQLVHHKILKENTVLRIGDILGVKGNCVLEDLFDESYYLSYAKAIYSKELAGKTLTLPARPDLSIGEKIQEAFTGADAGYFNKGRVAKKIMEDLSKQKLADFDKTTIDNFKKVFTAIGNVVKAWRK